MLPSAGPTAASPRTARSTRFTAASAGSREAPPSDRASWNVAAVLLASWYLPNNVKTQCVEPDFPGVCSNARFVPQTVTSSKLVIVAKHQMCLSSPGPSAAAHAGAQVPVRRYGGLP